MGISVGAASGRCDRDVGAHQTLHRRGWVTARPVAPLHLSPILRHPSVAGCRRTGLGYRWPSELSFREFETVSNKYEVWILDLGQKRIRNEPGYENLIGHADVAAKYTDQRAKFLVELRTFCRREFQ